MPAEPIARDKDRTSAVSRPAAPADKNRTGGWIRRGRDGMLPPSPDREDILAVRADPES
jgi:hypothetical protein